MPPIDTELRHLTRDQILAHARARGGRLRRQRQVARMVAAVALMGVASVPVLRATATTSDPDKVQVVDQTTTTTADDGQAAPGAATTTTTQSDPGTPTTTPPMTPHTPNTAGPTSTTTAPEPAAPSRACTGPEITFTVTTDKPEYLVGETVRVTARIRNNTNHRCYLPTQEFFHVEDAQGEPTSEVTMSNDVDYSSEDAWEGGETRVREFTWNQMCGPERGCPGNIPPRGTYRAVVTLRSDTHSYGTVKAAFELI